MPEVITICKDNLESLSQILVSGSAAELRCGFAAVLGSLFLVLGSAAAPLFLVRGSWITFVSRPLRRLR